MTISATTRGLRPGVCTSSTRPSSPFDGQLIYETDTDLVKAWDGSTWELIGPTPASTEGLTFVDAGSFTTVTSVSLPDNTFNSTYRNYRVIFQITGATGTHNMTMRLRNGGTDRTTQYHSMLTGLTNAGAGSNLSQVNGTSWTMGNVTGGNTIFTLGMDVIAPAIASYTMIHLQMVYFTGSDIVGRSGCLFHDQIGDSLSFISAGASSITGLYRVYRYKDSA